MKDEPEDGIVFLTNNSLTTLCVDVSPQEWRLAQSLHFQKFMKTIPSTETLVKRPSDARGRIDIDWLHGRYSFSFGDYHDPAHRGFRALRVINEDRIEPGGGFGTHPHRSMEIITYVIEGELEHKDSLGNGGIIKAGQIQYMSAGDGVLHSEFNPSPTNRAHLLQIWMLPRHAGGKPLYHEADPGARRVKNGLTTLVSGDGRDDSIAMRQDGVISFGDLAAGQNLTVEPDAELPYLWLQVIGGTLDANGVTLTSGDGASLGGVPLVLQASVDSEFLLFQLS